MRFLSYEAVVITVSVLVFDIVYTCTVQGQRTVRVTHHSETIIIPSLLPPAPCELVHLARGGVGWGSSERGRGPSATTAQTPTPTGVTRSEKMRERYTSTEES